MRITHHLLLCIAFFLSFSRANAQQSNLDSLNKKFTAHRDQLLQEKIYVHIDRAVYMTGETMWFKIYYTDGALHRPLDLSRVCYIEILDSDNQPVLQSKVALKKGGGSGSLFIPATINSGNFIVRAYTAWMKNFTPEYYFHSQIAIINPFRTPDLEKTVSVKPPDAQFFPEGGNLVHGIKSKVAFRVINESGKGILFYGALLNQNNDTITTFKPLKFGIGHFYLTPQVGQTYRAVIVDENRKTYTYRMPEPLSIGYTVEVSENQNINIRVTSSSAEKPFVYIFVHARQIVAKAEVAFLKNGVASIDLNKKDLSDGVSHITVFDEALHPVCERLYFKKPEKKLTLEVKADQTEYDLRRKGNIEIQANHVANAQANLSVTIYKLDSIPSPDQEDIESYFWLSSDLNGKIESPEYYMNSSDSLAAIASDNLMLTHGWRRFTWQGVLEKKASLSFIPELRGHIINADVLDPAGSPARSIHTYLSAPGKLIRLYGSRSSYQGKTYYEMNDFYGPHKIIVQTNQSRDSVYTIRVANPFSDKYAPITVPNLRLSSSLENDVLTKAISMQVQDVYADEVSNRPVHQVRDSAAFYGHADETYLLDDYTRFPVMEEVMREYVPGVLVRKRRDGFHFILLDKPKGGVLQDNPMILLDGVPLFDADEIMAFDPLKIKKLEVLTRQYYLGSMVFEGIVSYTTYQGDLGGFELNPRLVKLDYEGLQIRREFYSPVYENKQSRNSRTPDQRSQIFWAPDVKIASGQKQILSFYTSDLKGNYKVVVKGLSADGSPASATTAFHVKRFDN